MTPEEEQAALQFEALQHSNAADLLSIYILLRKLAPKLGIEGKDLDADFLRERKLILHKLLENLEKTQPERAAKLQEVIERSSTTFPFNY